MSNISDDLKKIDEYPDISFMGNYTIRQLEDEMIAWFKEKKKELTGEDVVLAAADDRRILLQAGAYFLYQGYMFVDDAGKMGLLKYSRGDYLENLGSLKHIYRKSAVGATTTIRFQLEAARNTTTGIPARTRMTAGDGMYFATDEYAEIAAGDTYVDVKATCMTPGSAGNDYGIGDIATIVDLVPYIDAAFNITKPENGTDIEEDESLRERIYEAPSAYSTAGTEASYKYYVKEFSQDVSDVEITSPSPGEVEIRYLLKDGVVPGEESTNALAEFLSQPDIKPTTDRITVMAPELKMYNISVKYYINSSDRNRAEVIQALVNKAIEEYKIWQRSKMGRDINPDILTRMMIQAGAKRLEITAPAFTVVPFGSVASLEGMVITYGGLEDD